MRPVSPDLVHERRDAEDREEVHRAVEPPDRGQVHDRRHAHALAGGAELLVLALLEVVRRAVRGHGHLQDTLPAARRADVVHLQVVRRHVRAHDRLHVLLVVPHDQPDEALLVHLPELVRVVQLQGRPHRGSRRVRQLRRLWLVPVRAAEDEARHEAQGAALGEPHGEHAEDRGAVRHDVGALHPHAVHDLRRLHHPEAEVDQDCGERRHRHRLQHGRHGVQAADDEEPLPEGGKPRLASALHVERAPRDDRGHGHA
mmetsp:Transcript_14232/g.42416  ORF Transcript_14232/g.42416 Transcript_14232/m.42416 type:complete len:257 (-) Transcript_14232:908-1678(-)